MKTFFMKIFIFGSPMLGYVNEPETNSSNYTTFIPDPHPSLKQDIECDFCKDIVGIIEHRLNKSNTTINTIEQLIERICSLMLSKPKREVCDTIVKDIDKVKNMIIDDLEPKDICYKMELCK